MTKNCILCTTSYPVYKSLKFRIPIFLMMTSLVIFEFMIVKWKYIISAFTQYGLVITWILFLTLVFSSFFLNLGIHINNILSDKILNIFFEVTWNAEATITIVFWLILFPATLFEESNGKDPETISDIIYQLLAHSLPLFLLTLDFLKNSVLFDFSHYLFSLGLILFYCIIALIYWIKTDYFPYQEYISSFHFMPFLFFLLSLLVHFFSMIIGIKISQYKMKYSNSEIYEINLAEKV